MNNSISERELRLRRRELHRAEQERLQSEILAREALQREIEILTQQRDQLNIDRRVTRLAGATNASFDFNESYLIRNVNIGETDSTLNTVDQIEFERHMSHNSTFLEQEQDKDNETLADLQKERLNESYLYVTREKENIDRAADSRVTYRRQSDNDGILNESSLLFDGTKRKDSRIDGRQSFLTELSETKPMRYMERTTPEIEFQKRDLADIERNIRQEDKRLEKQRNLDKLRREKEELERNMLEDKEYQRRLLMQQERDREMDLERQRVRQEMEAYRKEQENRMYSELRSEKELFLKEIETYRREMFEQNIRKDMEMEERRKEQEMKMRIDIESKIRRELEIEMHKEIEDRIRKEGEERLKMKEERDRIKESKLKEKREQRKQEELTLIKSTESLKLEEEDIDRKGNSCKEKEETMSDDEEDKIMQERLESLKKEMNKLQERVRNKRTTDNMCKSGKTESTSGAKPMGKPKLPQFDGTQFEAWKLEVTSLIESKLYQEYVLVQTVRNSITSSARKVLLTMKPSATTKEILKKMEDLYGNIRSGDSIIHDFYSAKQTDAEQCSEWGIRIETLFNQAVERGEIEESRKDKKLKERFWRGLSSDKIKTATRSSYEAHDSFDILRRKARIEEMELKIENSSVRSDRGTDMIETKDIKEDLKLCQAMQRSDETKSKMDQLLKKMDQLENDIKNMKRNQNSEQSNRERNQYEHYNRGRYFRGGYRSRGQRTDRFNRGSRYGDSRPNEESQTKDNDETKKEPSKSSEAKPSQEEKKSN